MRNEFPHESGRLLVVHHYKIGLHHERIGEIRVAKSSRDSSNRNANGNQTGRSKVSKFM